MSMQAIAWRRGIPQPPPPYYRELLSAARSLRDRGEYTLSVITAFMACELMTEQAMSWMYFVRGAAFLEEPVDSFITSYSLANNRVRELYNALSLERIQEEAFWPEYAKLAQARNHLVHGRRKGVHADAIDGIEAAEQFVRHLTIAMQLLPARAVGPQGESTGDAV